MADRTPQKHRAVIDAHVAVVHVVTFKTALKVAAGATLGVLLTVGATALIVGTWMVVVSL